MPSPVSNDRQPSLRHRIDDPDDAFAGMSVSGAATGAARATGTRSPPRGPHDAELVRIEADNRKIMASRQAARNKQRRIAQWHPSGLAESQQMAETARQLQTSAIPGMRAACRDLLYKCYRYWVTLYGKPMLEQLSLVKDLEDRFSKARSSEDFQQIFTMAGRLRDQLPQDIKAILNAMVAKLPPEAVDAIDACVEAVDGDFDRMFAELPHRVDEMSRCCGDPEVAARLDEFGGGLPGVKELIDLRQDVSHYRDAADQANTALLTAREDERRRLVNGLAHGEKHKEQERLRQRDETLAKAPPRQAPTDEVSGAALPLFGRLNQVSAQVTNTAIYQVGQNRALQNMWNNNGPAMNSFQ